MDNLEDIRARGKQIYVNQFGDHTNFERAVFFSWYCGIGDCKYCYMSTQPKGKKPEEARRRVESILAEVYLVKKLGWDFGQLAGGYQAFKDSEFEELLKYIVEIFGEKIWVNIGPLDENLVLRFKPYIKGIVGAVETIEPVLHNTVCPSKKLADVESTLKLALDNGLKTAITIILGLGEKKEDYEMLQSFIKKYNVDVIHYYALNPQKGTEFENAKSPSKEYQAWWIAKTRIDFPEIEIQCGIWADKVDQVAYLLDSGTNTVSKFPALKIFGKKESVELEHQFALAGRFARGTLTKLPKIDFMMDAEEYNLSDELKERIDAKVKLYLKKLS